MSHPFYLYNHDLKLQKYLFNDKGLETGQNVRTG